MVRRVGFGNSPAPDKRRKTRILDASNTPATRPDSAPSKPSAVQDRGTSIRATQLSRNLLMFKVAKIAVAVLIAIRIESNIMFIILFLWAGKEIWSLLRKTPTSMEPEQ